MQKEMQEADDAGFATSDRRCSKACLAGKRSRRSSRRTRDAVKNENYEYKLLATNKTSTMQKELQEVGEAGFLMIWMTVGKTLVGGNEVVSILRRPVRS